MPRIPHLDDHEAGATPSFWYDYSPNVRDKNDPVRNAYRRPKTISLHLSREATLVDGK